MEDLVPSDIHIGKADDSINSYKLCREGDSPSEHSVYIKPRLSRINVEYTFSGGDANNPKVQKQSNCQGSIEIGTAKSQHGVDVFCLPLSP